MLELAVDGYVVEQQVQVAEVWIVRVHIGHPDLAVGALGRRRLFPVRRSAD
ncbi:MAG: hypothetical protein ACRDO1_14805 [Nocardioidaceae bacterium]